MEALKARCAPRSASLNTFNDCGGPYNWSLQVQFDSVSLNVQPIVPFGAAAGTFVDLTGLSGGTPYQIDQWVELKAIVEQCAAATNVVMLSEFQLRSGPVLQQFIKQHGVIIKTLSDEVVTKLGETTGEVISELIAKDKFSAKVFKSMAKVRQEQIAYTDVTEGSFIHARKLKYKFPTG